MPVSLRLLLLFGTRHGLIGLVASGVIAAVLGGVLVASEPLSGRSALDRSAVGQVLHVEKSDDDEDPAYVVYAWFDDETGRRRRVRSYSDHAVEVGQEVTVRYDHASPDHAAIDGQRTHPEPWWSPLALLPFVIAVPVMAASAFRTWRLRLRLLARGIVTRATVVDRKKHEDGERTSWETTFELETVDRRVVTCAVITDREPPYEVGSAWPLLYDPGWPDHATPLAHLPGAPTITDDDRVIHRASRARTVIIWALLVVWANFVLGLPWAFLTWL